MERRLRLASFCALLAAQTAVACELVFPTHLGSTTAPDASPTGAPDASVRDAHVTDATIEEAPSTPQAACGTSPPQNTNATMAQPFGDDTILAAIKTIYYRQDGGPIADLGFDLDCVDTCPGPGSCTPRSSLQKNCDLSGGRDVAANFFLENFEDFQSTSASQSLDDRIAAGRLGFFIWLSSYNGMADDPDIVLATVGSTGTLEQSDGGPPIVPKWDGNDVWYVDPSSASLAIDDGSLHYLPNVISTQAYVANSTLVGSLANVPLDLFGTAITLSAATVVAQITPLPGVGYRLDGQLAGRISLHSLFMYISTLRDPLDDTKYLCGDDQTFMTLLPNFCASADIMSDPTEDNMKLTCDGMSVSIGFSAISAKIGPEHSRDPLIFGCDGSVAQCP